MKEVKVRFAPSPTGYLHIGGARTALYNYLFAKNNEGKFLLRIEDTDVERSKEEFTNLIMEDLQWLGIKWDEGPVFQSSRLNIYRKYAETLLERGLAYRCYCSPQELEEKRKKALKEGKKVGYDRTCREISTAREGKSAVRIKVPLSGETVFEDMLRGSISYQNNEIDDFIIVRRNGLPTYNFASVIDDALFNITHIIRGDDHIANTPKQIIIYRALDFPVPLFAHIPLIVGKDRSPLSKRHGAVSIRAFREMGFLKEAMLNYLARLGWGYRDREIFSIEELIELFNLKSVSLSPATFDMNKLRWINSQYIQKKSPEEIFKLLIPFLKEENIEVKESDKNFLMLIRELLPRAKTLVEMAEGSKFYFIAPTSYEEKGVRKFMDENGVKALKKVKSFLENFENNGIEKEKLEHFFRSLAEEEHLKLIKIAQPVRIALTGKTVSPGIFELISILGIKESLRRINKFLKYLEESS